MSQEPTVFTTPPARIVWGHPLKSKPKTNQKTKQKVLNDQQQEIPVWAFGLSWENHIFQQQILPYLQQEVGKAFPNGVPNDFSWKIKTESDVDSKGVPLGQREGYAGCTVLSCSTELKAPECYKRNPNGAFMQIAENEIKTGDFVVAELSIKNNASPGIYVNPNMVCLVGIGDAIASFEADPNSAFANVDFTVPQGAQPVQNIQQITTPPVNAPANAGMPVNTMVNAGPVVPTVNNTGSYMVGTGNVPVNGAPTAGIVHNQVQQPVQPGQAPLPGQGATVAGATVGPQPSATPQGVGFVQPATTSPTNGAQPAYDFVQNVVGK